MAASNNTVMTMIVAIVVVTIFSAAAADQGFATFYTRYTPSACNGFQNDGVMIAAASDPIFANKAACNRRYRVKCISGTNAVANPCRSGSVIVKVVDRCPSPHCRGTLDLSREAFSRIANPDAGKVKIEYTRI
nr:PREDICTED: EG45-like domain containing protein [Bemisia tabaci]